MLQMLRTILFFLALPFAVLHLSASGAAAASLDVHTDDSRHYGRFGLLHLIVPVERSVNGREEADNDRFVILVSGDGGWDSGMAGIARTISAAGFDVVGFDIKHYLRQIGRTSESCTYLAVDLENLSHYIQKELKFPKSTNVCISSTSRPIRNQIQNMKLWEN